MSRRGDAPGEAGGSRPDRLYDPAAQAERTALAWNRSLLALAANGVLLARAEPHTGRWAAVSGIAVVAAAVLCWLAAEAAYARARGRRARWVLAGPRAAGAFAILVAAVGIADLLAVVTYAR